MDSDRSNAGAPQRVWVSTVTTARKRYHTDPNCRKLAEATTRRDRRSLPDALDECSVCAGTLTQPSNQDRSAFRALKQAAETEGGDV